MRYIVKLCLACACASIPAAAYAEGGDSGSLRISVTVPEVCQIDATTVTHEESGITSASVLEMCNSGRGFTVFASHRGLQDGEEVQINYDGQVRQLDSSGLSEVAQRSGPIFGYVPVTIQSSGLVQGLAISLGLAAI